MARRLLTVTNTVQPKADSINYSEEQRAIATAIKDNYSVIVSAEAGSGKTTCIRHVVETLSAAEMDVSELNEDSDDFLESLMDFNVKRVLVLLYNKRLSDETKVRINGSNVKIGTIHAAASWLYGKNCRNDDGIKGILTENSAPVVDNCHFDVLVLDEAQDVTLLLAQIIFKIIKDCTVGQLLIMGDAGQCIYKFMSADAKFLTMADTIFGPALDQSNDATNNSDVTGDDVTGNNDAISNSKQQRQPQPWTRLTLSETYRCSIPITNFVNHCLLGEERMVSHRKSNIRPQYIVCKIFEAAETVNNIIDTYLALGNSYDDIAILAQSTTNSKLPVNVISNFLSKTGKLIDKKSEDLSVQDEKTSQGKIVVSTFHSFKGLERKMIIIVGFDANFYIAAKTESKDKCPNILYVACTRARDRLILLQDVSSGPLPFLNIQLLYQYCNVVSNSGEIKAQPVPDVPDRDRSYSVTQLVKFIPYTLYDELKPLWTETDITNFTDGANVTKNKDRSTIDLDMLIGFVHNSDGSGSKATAGRTVDVKGKGKANGSASQQIYYENVSAIYGCAIPLLKQHNLYGDHILCKLLQQHMPDAQTLKIQAIVSHVLHRINPSGVSTTGRNLNMNLSKNKKIVDISADDRYYDNFPHMINLYQCIIDGYIHPINQITNYDWYFSDRVQSGLQAGVERLSFISEGDEFEYGVRHSQKINIIDQRYVNVTVKGSIDCIHVTEEEDVPFEFKFVNSLDSNHKLQAIVYACLLYLTSGVTSDYHLFNIRDAQHVLIHVNDIDKNAAVILERLVKHKLLSNDGDELDITSITAQLHI